MKTLEEIAEVMATLKDYGLSRNVIWSCEDGKEFHCRLDFESVFILDDEGGWDSEPITPDDLPLLHKCVSDINADRGGYHLLDVVFVSRKRQVKPVVNFGGNQHLFWSPEA